MARSYTRIVDGHSSKLLILRPARVLARDTRQKFQILSDRSRACFILRLVDCSLTDLARRSYTALLSSLNL